jgi:hypothetical protein
MWRRSQDTRRGRARAQPQHSHAVNSPVHIVSEVESSRRFLWRGDAALAGKHHKCFHNAETNTVELMVPAQNGKASWHVQFSLVHVHVRPHLAARLEAKVEAVLGQRQQNVKLALHTKAEPANQTAPEASAHFKQTRVRNLLTPPWPFPTAVQVYIFMAFQTQRTAVGTRASTLSKYLTSTLEKSAGDSLQRFSTSPTAAPNSNGPRPARGLKSNVSMRRAARCPRRTP